MGVTDSCAGGSVDPGGAELRGPLGDPTGAGI